MPSKRNKDSEALDRLMNSLKIKVTKLTKNRGKFVDCMANFSSIYMHSCEDLTETTGLLIAIIEKIDSVLLREFPARNISFGSLFFGLDKNAIEKIRTR